MLYHLWKVLLRLIAVVAATLACAAAMADLPVFEGKYIVKQWGSIKVGAVTIRSTPNSNSELLLEATLTPIGLAGALLGSKSEIRSLMRWQGEHVVPLEWHLFPLNSPDDGTYYKFDPDTSSVDIIYKRRDYELSVPHNIHDVISMHIQLATDMQNNTRELVYNIVSKNKLRRYVFSRKGNELLSTSLGEARAVELARSRNGKLDARYWLSPAHGYLPVRFERIRHGKIKYTVEAVSLDYVVP